MRGILVALLFIEYSILSVSSFLSIEECGKSRLSFGGRLLLPNPSGMASAWDGSRKFIFQIPRMKRPMPYYNGRGRMWVSTTSRSCGGNPQGHCPANDVFPCMSSNKPCLVGPPKFKARDPITISELTSDGVTLTIPEWNHDIGNGKGPVTGWKIWCRSEDGDFQNFTKDISDTSHRLHLQPDNIRIATTSVNRRYARLVIRWWIGAGVCGGIHNQTIRIEQLDRDGCDNRTADLFHHFEVLRANARQYQRRKLNPNSLFRVTVTLVTGSGREKSISKLKRTQMTAPTGEPEVHEPIRRTNGILFKWSELPCGVRNSDVINYEYVLTTSDGKKWGARTEEKRVLFKSLTAGDTYTFKVRAVSQFRHGKYSQPQNVIFG